MGMRITYPNYAEPGDYLGDKTTPFLASGNAVTLTYATFGRQVCTDNCTTVFLHIYYTKGDESKVQIQGRWSLTAAGTQAKETVGSTAASGVTTVLIAEYDLASTDNYVLPIRVSGRYLQFYIKAADGTPTGTFGAGLYTMRE